MSNGNAGYVAATFIKGTGEDELKVYINGFVTGQDALSIHEIIANDKFKEDLEPMPFDLGLQYSYEELKDHFVTNETYTTAQVVVNDSVIDLTV